MPSCATLSRHAPPPVCPPAAHPQAGAAAEAAQGAAHELSDAAMERLEETRTAAGKRSLVGWLGIKPQCAKGCATLGHQLGVAPPTLACAGQVAGSAAASACDAAAGTAAAAGDAAWGAGEGAAYTAGAAVGAAQVGCSLGAANRLHCAWAPVVALFQLCP